MQPLQISAEEVFDAYKRQIADLSHELLLAQLRVAKMKERIEQYEAAETERVHQAATQRAAAASAPPEPPAVPGLPPQPLTGAMVPATVMNGRTSE